MVSNPEADIGVYDRVSNTLILKEARERLTGFSNFFWLLTRLCIYLESVLFTVF
jgi:hypothetical protein